MALQKQLAKERTQRTTRCLLLVSEGFQSSEPHWRNKPDSSRVLFQVSCSGNHTFWPIMKTSQHFWNPIQKTKSLSAKQIVSNVVSNSSLILKNEVSVHVYLKKSQFYLFQPYPFTKCHLMKITGGWLFQSCNKEASRTLTQGANFFFKILEFQILFYICMLSRGEGKLLGNSAVCVVVPQAKLFLMSQGESPKQTHCHSSTHSFLQSCLEVSLECSAATGPGDCCIHPAPVSPPFPLLCFRIETAIAVPHFLSLQLHCISIRVSLFPSFHLMTLAMVSLGGGGKTRSSSRGRWTPNFIWGDILCCLPQWPKILVMAVQFFTWLFKGFQKSM